MRWSRFQPEFYSCATKSTTISLHLLCLSVLRVHQLGEVKSFLRLLQDDDQDFLAGATIGRMKDLEKPGGGAVPSTFVGRPSTTGDFLTLPMLQAFVDGGDEFLASRKRSFQELEQRKSDDIPRKESSGSSFSAETAVKSGADKADSDARSRRSIPRVNSWTDDETEPGGGVTVEHKDILLDKLQATLYNVTGGPETRDNNSRGCGGGVCGYLSSFDIDDDGRLSTKEFMTALRSLGARGAQFGRHRGLRLLVEHFGSGDRTSNLGDDDYISISNIVGWQNRSGALERNGDSEHCKDNPIQSGIREERDGTARVRAKDHVAGEALQRAIRISEARGTTLERTFARLDEDGDGYITLRQLLRGLEGMGVFEHVSTLHSTCARTP